MKFLCPNCKAKYQIADEKVSGRTLRMDCRRCGHNITIRADMAIDDAEEAAAKPAPAPTAAKPASASASTRRAGLTGAHAAQPAGASLGGSLGADFHRSVSKPHAVGAMSGPAETRTTPLDQWHVAINDVPVGPLRREEIVKKIGAGAVTADSLCWREGLDDWRPLRDVPELAALLRRSLSPEPAPRGAPVRPTPAGAPAGAPRAGAPLARGPAAAAPRAAAPTSARSNVVPIGGRLGGAAASALDDDLEVDEPTRVGSVDMAELEAKAFAAERESSKKADEAKADLFPDVKRPPTGKTSTRDPGLAPPPKPAARPDTGKNALPLVAAKPIAKPAPKPAPEIVDEPDLPFDEPSFADVPAAPPEAPAPAFVSAPLPLAPMPVAAAPVASVAPREEEKRRGGGIPIPALIAIAGATAFGGVMAYMLGTHFLGPATTAPAIATVQPTTAPPPTTTTAPPPTATIETAPETPPATTAVAPETPPATTTAPPATTAGAHTGRPHAGGTGTAAGTTTTAGSGGAQSATKAPTGRFAEFADDGEGPAQIATTGRTSIADEPGGGSSGGNTRGQQELTADQIRAVITRERPAVNRCWESELRRLGQAATVRLDVDLTIGGSGTVTSVTTRGQSVGTLADCIERNVRRWRFPPVNGSTQTSFPLVFSGTE